ncbi:MAG: hypothetical protein HY717_17000 [Planctomycetes bacterium]|nr:hypothetical protein [Planctomycetota bacterium]
MNRMLLIFSLAFLWSPDSLLGQALVPPVWDTAPISGANIDSVAVWAAPHLPDSLLFVTEKDLDRVEVRWAENGQLYPPKPFLGGPLDSSQPGEFDRPNGVWVIYHVPHAQGFSDILLVTDQRNLRVQVFRLPQLDHFGELGTGEIGKGYGIAWYQDGRDFFIYISDDIPPADHPGKLKKYRLKPAGDKLGAELVLAFGSESGPPPLPALPNVESILADPVYNRLHVCGDEGGKFNRIFQLDGAYTGIAYGDPQFEFDQEGINLYDTGDGEGYLLVSDQHTDGTPNQFELFDRKTLQPLGNFQSPSGGAIVTRNTDGAYLEQRPLAGFPNGAFFAVHDDQSVHAYDWTDVASAVKLVIEPLYRPFPVRSLGQTVPAAAGLWFQGGFWWGIFPLPDGLTISRLEDGAFVPVQLVAAGGEAAPAAAMGNSRSPMRCCCWVTCSSTPRRRSRRSRAAAPIPDPMSCRARARRFAPRGERRGR